MNIHEARMRALRFEKPDYIPCTVDFLPATWMKYRDALEDLVLSHPALFPGYEGGRRDFDDVGSVTFESGQYVDEWGCVWSNIFKGVTALVTGHPLPRREMINGLTAPPPGAGFPHGFMFLRLTYLRGFEECMIDFAEEPPELQRLIDLVRDYNISEVEDYLSANTPDIVYFGDDLGMQTSLPISPEKWRKYLKPAFRSIYAPCKSNGAAVCMHTDGHIIPIIKDLIDCGVDVVNPQFRANGLENLVRECKGRLCVNLDLDRQMFPFAKPSELDSHVLESVKALGSREGGLWMVAECGPDVPLDNIEALCAAFEKYMGYWS
jgi:uroporphyrinogen decarboxylase